MKKHIANYFMFFLLLASVVTVAVLIFNAVRGYESTVIFVVMVAVIFALSLVCTLVDAYRRKKHEEEPVESILEATKRIAAGDFEVRLAPRHSEKHFNSFDVIMENINDMAAQLAKAEAQGKDFVSNVSHELKTPLAVLQTYSDALLTKSATEEERSQYVAVIHSTVKRMSALVRDILSLSRLEAMQLLPPAEDVDLEETLGECAVGFDELLDKKKIELCCDFEAGLKISSVRAYVELIFNNLLSNAVKFSHEGGRIELTARGIEDGAVLSVRDYGEGMDAATGEHIFERFYQGDVSHAREGSGLGLATVKKAIELLGGEIGVQSALGEGSCFTVTLRNLPKT